MTNTADKVDFYFKLVKLVLRSMDSLAHLMLNANLLYFTSFITIFGVIFKVTFRKTKIVRYLLRKVPILVQKEPNLGR